MIASTGWRRWLPSLRPPAGDGGYLVCPPSGDGGYTCKCKACKCGKFKFESKFEFNFHEATNHPKERNTYIGRCGPALCQLFRSFTRDRILGVFGLSLVSRWGQSI